VSTIADDETSVAPRPLAAHHPTGISTGVFAAERGDWPALVAEACCVSTFAVELSALSGDELPGLVAYLQAKPRLPFRYVSVHAPVKNREPDESATVAMLGALPLWVRSVIAHPDCLFDVGRYRALGTRLVLENMDDRKVTGRVAAEMESFFDELPDAGFCLDIAHGRSIDPTMDAAHTLLDRFRSRLRQVHLSSLSDGRHVPIGANDEDLFVEVLDRCRDVPWILEARAPERWAAQLKTTAIVAPGATSASAQA
jgi:Xylose isomerase-like TIM barrel